MDERGAAAGLLRKVHWLFSEANTWPSTGAHMRTGISILLAAWIILLSSAAANAQNPYCSVYPPYPLTFPACAVGFVIAGATALLRIPSFGSTAVPLPPDYLYTYYGPGYLYFGQRYQYPR